MKANSTMKWYLNTAGIAWKKQQRQQEMRKGEFLNNLQVCHTKSSGQLETKICSSSKNTDQTMAASGKRYKYTEILFTTLSGYKAMLLFMSTPSYLMWLSYQPQRVLTTFVVYSKSHNNFRSFWIKISEWLGLNYYCLKPLQWSSTELISLPACKCYSFFCGTPLFQKKMGKKDSLSPGMKLVLRMRH